MSSLQLSFSVRVTASTRSVVLVGTWDNYQSQLPLSLDKSSSKSGKWKGTFNFKNNLVRPGKRYWYYYILDGSRIVHNPSEDSTLEPTTNQTLNILDVPASSSSSSSKKEKKSSSSKPVRRRDSVSSNSSSEGYAPIYAPVPVSHAAQHTILSTKFEKELDSIATKFTHMQVYDASGAEDDIIRYMGPSDGSELDSPLSAGYSSSSSGNYSGYSTPSSDASVCSCQRYGITRAGQRVQLDCHGTRCGYTSCESDCYSSDDEAASPQPRRAGMVMA